MKTAFLSLATTAFVAATAVAAQAETVCMDTDEMQAALIDWYQEAPVAEPVAHNDSSVRLWASKDSGTWTLVRTELDQSCVVAQGEGWTDEQDSGSFQMSMLED